MTDYLTTKYNAELTAIQGREAAALEAALTIYAKAVKEITDKAAAERLEAGVADAAARSQRDHEYHNGRPEPETSKTIAVVDPSRPEPKMIFAHVGGPPMQPFTWPSDVSDPTRTSLTDVRFDRDTDEE